MRLVPQPHVHRPRQLPQPAPIIPLVLPLEVPTVVLVRVLHVSDRPERKESLALALQAQPGALFVARERRRGRRIDPAQARCGGRSGPRSVGPLPSARLDDAVAAAGSRAEGGECCRGGGIEKCHGIAGRSADKHQLSQPLIGSRLWGARESTNRKSRDERSSCAPLKLSVEEAGFASGVIRCLRSCGRDRAGRGRLCEVGVMTCNLSDRFHFYPPE